MQKSFGAAAVVGADHHYASVREGVSGQVRVCRITGKIAAAADPDDYWQRGHPRVGRPNREVEPLIPTRGTPRLRRRCAELECVACSRPGRYRRRGGEPVRADRRSSKGNPAEDGHAVLSLAAHTACRGLHLDNSHLAILASLTSGQATDDKYLPDSPSSVPQAER